LSQRRWNVLPALPPGRLASVSGFPPIVAQLLFNRGLGGAADLDSFLCADARLCGDPELLPAMPQAVARLYRALLSGEKIAVYGDFDTDGVTATALMVEGLSRLKADVVPYIPHRLTEGYGLKPAALEGLYNQGVSLVVSVDCGISGLAAVRRAKRLGLDIIITDHHVPPETLPAALAIVDPKLPGSSYSFADLSGAGVALKLLQALLRTVGREEETSGLLDLVALGTVADMVPLVGENRYLVKEGLKQLNGAPRLGLRELLARSGAGPGEIDSERISWVLAPRLNAAGRLDHAMASYNLLTTVRAEEAQTIAGWLEEKNAERQALTAKALAVAREQVVARGLQPVLFAGDADFPAGICGLVASRLAEEFYRPAVVVRIGDQLSSGSCRSIPEFNIVDALTRCGHLFTHFGGHAQAAGFGILTRRLDTLAQSLLETAGAQLAGLDLRPTIDIDVEVRLSELGGNVFPMIQRMAPFGQGNPLPVFLSRRVEVLERRLLGSKGEHLRLKVKQAGTVWDAIAFGMGAEAAKAHSLLDIVYNLEVDRWNGAERLRLNVLDFAPSV